MSNWCFTAFTVSGPAEELTRFREAARGSDDTRETPFDFNRLMPAPRELREHADPSNRTRADRWKMDTTGRHRVPKWCEWTRGNWDPQWNACRAELTDNEDGSLHVQFDTAEGFPLPIFFQLMLDFPQLLFEGTAYAPHFDAYVRFEGRDGKFALEDHEDARTQAAEAHAEEDRSPKVTA